VTTVRDAMEQIIIGRNVKRGRHDLTLNEKDLTATFIEVLREHRFRPMTVQEVDVDPGERVPAFHIAEGTATFGWVFWEKFTERRKRKLFGSVTRNPKGDWAIQIPPSRHDVLYVCPEGKTEMDIDHPPVL
jgi:hypothetical protein